MFFDFVILIFATTQLLEIWHHGEIAVSWRIWAEEFNNWFGYLATCMFCLSVWAAALLWLLWQLSDGSHIFPTWLNAGLWLLKVPIFALAISRAANLLNDVTRSFNRTPKD